MKLLAARHMRLRDVLVLRIGGWEAEPEDSDERKTIADFAYQLSQTTRMSVVVIDADLGLESLSESQMREAGWTRIRQGATA